MATLRPFLVLILTIVLKIALINSNFPDATGGYSITVAFEESISQPDNQTAINLLNNVQETFSSFSEKLWQTTRHKFYIKSVDILVPSTWTLENVTYSITNNYNTAAVRISSSAILARSENPFTCGQPGNFIELPADFFNNSDTGRYATNWKALLNLWASYRWGVHEEHGYVGSSKYPYAYNNIETGNWQVTGCSDRPIVGRFTSNDSSACSASDTWNASSTCRFIPDQAATNATTSIMHFHWIESIVGFCDETNHNKLSPNRQNLFCDYKSAWEVIRETRDFQIASNPINENIPSVKFQVVQHSKNPRLYILLDRGLIQNSIGLASLIPRALASFLNDPARNDTLAAVGSYPGVEGAESVNQEIDWLPVSSNLERFLDVIGELKTSGPLQRNFPQAILAAVSQIKATSNQNGVVMLAIKYGADLSNFDNYDPESEIIQALNEQGIVLNAIELSIANHSGQSHLSEVARETGGTYTVISNFMEAPASFGNFFWHLNAILQEDLKEFQKNYRSLLKAEVTPGSITRFRTPKSVNNPTTPPGTIEAYFSSMDGSLSRNSFAVEGVSFADGSVITIDKVMFKKRQDWEEKESKWTYQLRLSSEEIVPFTELSIRTNCLGCQGTMLVRTDLADDVSENVTITVFTNMDNSSVDLSKFGPIIIFAKIEKSGSPIVGAQVLAKVTDIGRQTTSYRSLADNGDGAPDEEAFDGLYSAYFVPSQDGQYKISVSVQGSSETYSQFSQQSSILKYFDKHSLQNNIKQTAQGRLLPIDQDMECFGAQCDSEELPANFMQSADLLSYVKVSNSAAYTPEPTKIFWFIATLDSASDSVTLMWVAPQIPDTPLISASSYDLRQASSKESLINDFENQQQVPVVSTIKPGVPGALEMIKVAKPAKTTFYAIRSTYRGQKSKMSAVSEIEIKDGDTGTTIETTTESIPTTSEVTETTTTDYIPTTSGVTETGTVPSTLPTTPEVTGTGSEPTTLPPTTPDVTEPTTLPPTTPDVTETGTRPTSMPTTSDAPVTGTQDEGTSTPPTSDSTDPIIATTQEPEEKKPWAKTGGGIAIITIIVVIVVVVIVFVAYYIWRKRRATTVVKINPPPVQPRSSILP